MADVEEIISSELAQVQQKAPNIEGVTLEAAVRNIVRATIRLQGLRTITTCMQFPAEYPKEPIVIELKSKTLPEKVCDKITKICEEEAKKMAWSKTGDVNDQLCEGIFNRKPIMYDTVVLKQATSKVVYRISQEQYFMQFVLVVPEEYPIKQVKIELEDHNFPEILKVNFISQATEIARKCVQPPIKKKPKDPPFEPQPSVLPVVKFLVESVKKFPVMCCPLCKERVLPQNPSEPVTDKRRRMEKLYCGHLFHFICLYKYIKTPPFTGKICPDCGNAIYHDKFKLSPQLMEARWAHKQARQRELDEVVDFLD
ncbi:unnamed protein product [Mytilus edulis]|uniref:RING-type domain-containing protein n=1 Tax=Mytilus edulis TaxID=6550 RepID=A0A8S3U6U6_MYTED|nr:unnamed protein product [Mytilus edulis]